MAGRSPPGVADNNVTPEVSSEETRFEGLPSADGDAFRRWVDLIPRQKPLQVDLHPKMMTSIGNCWKNRKEGSDCSPAYLQQEHPWS